MAIRLPQSMDECVYYTLRSIGDKGKVRAWIYRNTCPKCKQAMMTKPRDPKTGNFKIRASEYVCPKCNFTINEDEYAQTLNLQAIYTCPKCSNQGEVEIPAKRKKIKIFDEEEQKEKTADAYQFQCSKCSEKINITKKMK